MSETELQNEIRLELSKHGIVVRMNTGVFLTSDGRTVKCGIKGMSDLLFIGDGKIAFIEVKTPTGRVRPEQRNFIERMQILHHRAGIARTIQEALELIE